MTDTNPSSNQDLIRILRTRYGAMDVRTKEAANVIERQNAEIERLRPMAESWESYEAAQERKGSPDECDLAPCPFCSSTDLGLQYKPDPCPESYPQGVWAIECDECGALGPFCEGRENAPKAWNDCKRRPAVETSAVRVEGDTLPTTLWQFKQRANVLLSDEQAKANPDNAFIGFICDAVRLARENERLAKAPLHSAGNHAPACAAHDGKRCNCGMGSPEEPTAGNHAAGCGAHDGKRCDCHMRGYRDATGELVLPQEKAT